MFLSLPRLPLCSALTSLLADFAIPLLQKAVPRHESSPHQELSP